VSSSNLGQRPEGVQPTETCRKSKRKTSFSKTDWPGGETLPPEIREDGGSGQQKRKRQTGNQERDTGKNHSLKRTRKKKAKTQGDDLGGQTESNQKKKAPRESSQKKKRRKNDRVGKKSRGGRGGVYKTEGHARDKKTGLGELFDG